MPYAEQKNNLREKVLARIKSEPGDALAKADAAAQKALLNADVWRDAKSVALYVSRPRETSTALLLAEAWSAGKIVLLPQIVDSEAKKMFLAPAAGPEDLTPGAYGIPEPARKIHRQEIFPDLIVMPGLAFDLRGGRLGYGGGYYDRFFVSNISIVSPRVALCRHFQILPAIPMDSRDYPVNAVCDEEGLKWL